jgi:hypothetical protein
MLITPFLSACASKFVSPVQPTPGQLLCSSGEGPIAERYYEGTFKWVCGPLACPADQEAVWRPIKGSEATAGLWGLRSRAGVQKVSFTCGSHCDSGDPRRPDGECPGSYFLHSRVEQNTLILTAVVIPPGSHASTANFKPTSSKDNYLRTKGVVITIDDDRVQRPSRTTDEKGEVRFDLAAEPFRHLVDSTDLIFFSATGRFKDGSMGTTMAVSTFESQLAREARARSQADAQAKRNERERADADSDAKRRGVNADDLPKARRESGQFAAAADVSQKPQVKALSEQFCGHDVKQKVSEGRPGESGGDGEVCFNIGLWISQVFTIASIRLSESAEYFELSCKLGFAPGCARPEIARARAAEQQEDRARDQKACAEVAPCHRRCAGVKACIGRCSLPYDKTCGERCSRSDTACSLQQCFQLEAACEKGRQPVK